MHMQYTIAFLFLLLLSLALLAWIAWLLFRPSGYSPLQRVLLFMDWLLVKFLWRGDVPRHLPLEPGQGAVVICNHRSSVDPFFIQFACDKPSHWMVAREYCEHPAFGLFLRQCEVIPTSRGGIDTKAIRQAIRLAQGGGIVGMFPEGRINMTERFMLPIRPGAVMIALRAQVPIVPIYIEGAPYRRVPWSPFFMPARVKVRVGEPVDLSQYYDQNVSSQQQREIMLMLVQEIAELAERSDVEFAVAGRDWRPTAEQLEADMAEGDRRLAR
jgi:1-acyl-sn-glycerol-3-phosphate acyltransferase